jgi:endonuclease/exonuclease/phosphatase family metal-dependent hydrolase
VCQHPAVLRVLTWNLWWRNGSWQDRFEAIAVTLERVAADVVCLQEVWGEEGGEDQAQLLARRLGLHCARTPQHYWDGVSFGNAVLARWPIAESDVHRLRGADGRLSHRMVLAAVVEPPWGRVPVFTTHLDWRYDASDLRLRQVAEVARFVAGRRGDLDASFPSILTGDLNATPASDEIRALTGLAAVPVPGLTFHDAWEQGGDGTAGHTWSKANPYLADATWPGRRLDYVLVAWPRRRPLGNVVSCRLEGVAPVAGVQASDHYAVVAELRSP